MTTFAVISDSDNAKLAARVSDVFLDGNVHVVDSHLLLISSDKDVVAKSVYEKIAGEDFDCKSNDNIGRFVIFSISSYYGMHSTSLWEWLDGKVN